MPQTRLIYTRQGRDIGERCPVCKLSVYYTEVVHRPQAAKEFVEHSCAVILASMREVTRFLRDL